jgi:hypothetical protein
MSDKRFFVINTNHDEFVKLEIFPMAHPVGFRATLFATVAGDDRFRLAARRPASLKVMPRRAITWGPAWGCDANMGDRR